MTPRSRNDARARATASVAARKPSSPGPARAIKRRLPDILTREQAAAVLAVPNTKSPRGAQQRALMEIMYRAGLRIAEALALRPEDVRFSEHLIRVRHGKGGKQRLVPIRPSLQGYLEAWDAIRDETCPGAEWFFVSERGNPMHQNNFRHAFCDRIVPKAIADNPTLGLEKIARISPHILRHTCATEWLEDGLSLADVRDLLGHANLATTSIYLHTRPTDLMAKVRALDG